jgi:SAM-dependent methyltransferase
MNHKLLEQLSCVKCKTGKFGTAARLTKTVGKNGSGTLTCGNCGETYPVLNEIARFVPASNYADSFGFQWNTHAATQLDSHCNVTVSRDRVFSVTRWPEDLKGEMILEAGSGAGRFTEVLVKTGAQILSFDFSSAVDANRRNNGGNENLLIFQGNIFDIPVPDQSMDKVFCLGVIQHTPDPKAAFMSLASKVKPGGSLVIDIYALDLKAMFQWKYALRPITMGINNEKLYKFIAAVTPVLVAPTKLLRKLAGRWGARLSPIVEYSYLGLDDKTNKQWAILDTFDMYSPAHDHPQSEATVRDWFTEIGFEQVHVGRGPNGVVGHGVRPTA